MTNFTPGPAYNYCEFHAPPDRNLIHLSMNGVFWSFNTIVQSVVLYFVRTRRHTRELGDSVYIIWCMILLSRVFYNLTCFLTVIIESLPRHMYEYIYCETRICRNYAGFVILSFGILLNGNMQVLLSLYYLIVMRQPVYFHYVKNSKEWRTKVNIAVGFATSVAVFTGLGSLTHTAIRKCEMGYALFEVEEHPLLRVPSPLLVYQVQITVMGGASALCLFVYSYILLTNTRCCSGTCNSSQNETASLAERRIGTIGLISFAITLLYDTLYLAFGAVLPRYILWTVGAFDNGIDPWLLLLKSRVVRRQLRDMITLKAINVTKRLSRSSGRWSSAECETRKEVLTNDEAAVVMVTDGDVVMDGSGDVVHESNNNTASVIGHDDIEIID